MTGRIEKVEDISVDYRTLRKIVDEVTRKYGVDVVVNLPEISVDVH